MIYSTTWMTLTFSQVDRGLKKAHTAVLACLFVYVSPAKFLVDQEDMWYIWNMQSCNNLRSPINFLRFFFFSVSTWVTCKSMKLSIFVWQASRACVPLVWQKFMLDMSCKLLLNHIVYAFCAYGHIYLQPFYVTFNFSSSVFFLMVVLARSSLLCVLHTWMSGTIPLQTPRAWFWGTHKWAISAALLAGGVSRTVGNVLVFGPPLRRGIEQRSLRQSSWDGYSVCSGLFWGKGWWSVDVVAAGGVCPGLGCSDFQWPLPWRNDAKKARPAWFHFLRQLNWWAWYVMWCYSSSVWMVFYCLLKRIL